MKKLLAYFSRLEIALWCTSVTLILVSFIAFDRTNYLALAASLIGVSSLIFCAKGSPIGQALMILFSLIYAVISHSFAYYGEMITYLGMTMPMAVIALVAWLRNPYDGNRAEVRVNAIGGGEVLFMCGLSAAVTVVFYFILAHFGTANLIPSTLSVTTSFIAVYLSFRRSPWFALAYAANDAVLILLWAMASLADIHYIPVTACFAAFLFNDIYGFVNWQRMKKRQKG